MKKLFILLSISCLFFTSASIPVNAGIVENFKIKVEKNKAVNRQVEEISKFFEEQTLLSNKKDLDALSKLYSSKYVNSDGFNKEIYFKLIKDTWNIYKDIAYASKIRSIDIKGNYASVDVLEAAIAVTEGFDEIMTASGELTSLVKCTYFLEKIGDRWLITAEYIANEKTYLKYGEAKYLNIDLVVPEVVYAGSDYTVTLDADLPADTTAVASISREKIVYPEIRSDEVYRKLPDSNILERVFTANKDNLNEYAVASMGITRTKPIDNKNFKIYMSGLAFLMTRVNVIPINNFIKEEVQNVQKSE